MLLDQDKEVFPRLQQAIMGNLFSYITKSIFLKSRLAEFVRNVIPS